MEWRQSNSVAYPCRMVLQFALRPQFKKSPPSPTVPPDLQNHKIIPGLPAESHSALAAFSEPTGKMN